MERELPELTARYVWDAVALAVTWPSDFCPKTAVEVVEVVGQLETFGWPSLICVIGTHTEVLVVVGQLETFGWPSLICVIGTHTEVLVVVGQLETTLG